MNINQLPIIAIAAMTMTFRSSIVDMLESIGGQFTTDEEEYVRFDLPVKDGATIVVSFKNEEAVSAVVSTGKDPIPSIYGSPIMGKTGVLFGQSNTLIKKLRAEYFKNKHEKTMEQLPIAKDMVRTIYVTDALGGHVGVRYEREGTTIGKLTTYDTGTASMSPAIVIATA